MDWKRLAVIGAAVLLAAWAGVKLAGPDPGGIALAAGGTGVEPAKGLVAVTTGAPGQDTNRLILVDTVTKRLAVYKIGGKSLRLIALRSYNFDMKIDDTAEFPGKDFTYEQIKELVLKSNLPENQKTAPPVGREMVLTTDGDNNLDANRIILINPEEKRVAIYRLNGNQLFLVAARRYDFDLIPEFIRGAIPADGYDRKFMKEDKERKDNPL
jgi:hypothetical protein